MNNNLNIDDDDDNNGDININIKNKNKDNINNKKNIPPPPDIENKNIPDTLEFTMPSFTEFDYMNGKYHAEIIASEKESVRTQTDIMAYYIRNGMKHLWDGYEECAYGKDELKPISCDGINNWGGIGMTIVDSLDTLYLMKLYKEFNGAEDWVEDNLNFDNVQGKQSFFEIGIRVLGGLLGAYSVSKKEIFKEKAIDLADRMISSFQNDTFPHV